MRRSSSAMRFVWATTLFFVLLVIFSAGCRKPQPVVDENAGQKVPSTDEAAPSANTDAPDADTPQETLVATTVAVETGPQLYERHCAACHGANGDAQGIAAAYLFPKPRDFQAGRFRLVSTVNRTPSHDDLLGVLKRGMPGSAMPPWDHLSDEELDLLVGEVQRLYREGVRQQYVKILVEDEELSDEELEDPDVQDEIEEHVAQRTTPGDTTEVPAIAAADAEAIARGKEIYLRQACNKCHGDTGRGDGRQQMVDDEGYPMTPRDFTAGIFKGGHDPASIYRRIAYGMPGTPMPSSQLTPAEVIDLSHFVLSLSDEETRQNALQKRKQLTAVRVAKLPDDAVGRAWDDVAATNMHMVPLWWRNEAHPEIQVKAVHDGQSIALQLSWQDETHNPHAATNASFEDAVALELFGGENEPFVGMGGPHSPVDAWFWDADRQTPLTTEGRYPNTVVDIYPFDEKQVDTAEGDRPGASTAAQPPISLPAVASGNQIVPTTHETGSGASSLAAGGPGTVTFRMPKNQAVDARGLWVDGRWRVVLKRALTVPAGDGVSLTPGDRVSLACAVWNGAKNDRDGQKLITVWNDLTLED